MPPAKAYTDFQVQVLLERVLRRPLWKVQREGAVYQVWTTAAESPIRVACVDIAESLANGNMRATAGLQKTLLEFHSTGIPDKDGNDITGRVSPRNQSPVPKPGFFARLFGAKPDTPSNGG